MASSISTEKKLQLIHRIRQEHQNNQSTIRGREAILYGKSLPYGALPEDGAEYFPEGEVPVSTFRFRAVIALFLFLVFYVLSSRNETIFGLRTDQLQEAVAEDYSPILFDFIGEIPYTLHEADTQR